MDVEERLLSVLKKEGIDYERTTHEPVYTSKEAAEVRNVPLDTGVKAMVLEGNEGKLLLGLVPADHRNPLKTYLDPEVLEKDEVNFNAGGHEVSVAIVADDLPDCIEASGAELEILDIKE